MKYFLSFFLFACFVSYSFSQDVKPSSTSLTIYQMDYCIVRQKLEFNLFDQVAKINFDKFPTKLVENSVFLNFEGEVLEESFSFKMLDFMSSLREAIGKNITLVNPQNISYKGKLAYVEDEEIILNLDDGSSLFVKDLEGYSILIDNYALNFTTKPVIQWFLKPKKSGLQSANLVYHTRGLSWNTKYFIYLDDVNSKLSLSAWVMLQNNSGIDFKDSKVTILEGDVNIQNYYVPDFKRAEALSSAMVKQDVSEQPVFEYYKYDFPQNITLNNGESKLLKIFSTKDVAYKKTYKYSINTWLPVFTKSNPNIFITFANQKNNNLGFLLPKGQADFYFIGKNELEFVGQNTIGASLENEDVSTFVGKANDIVVEVIANEITTISENLKRVRIELNLKNFKKTEAVCEVEYFESSPFDFIEANIKPKEKKPQRLVFEIPLKPQSSFNFSFIVNLKR